MGLQLEMFDSGENSEVETLETEADINIAPKRFTMADIEHRLRRTPNEIWITLLKRKYKYSAMTLSEWYQAIETIGGERV